MQCSYSKPHTFNYTGVFSKLEFSSLSSVIKIKDLPLSNFTDEENN